MPLLKLWNSLRGRTNQPSAPDASNSEIRPAHEPNSGCQQPHAQTLGRSPTAATQASGTKRASRPKAKTLGLFRSGPHAALCKQLKSIRASSVLEISVGDGSRAVAVVQALAKSSPESVRYVAVDEFEMVGGTTPLIQFFQTLRAAGIRPQLFPEPVERGLMRVAHTIGALDLVLIAAPLSAWQTPQVQQLLSRVCHMKTAVFYQDEQENWLRYQPAWQAQRRAA